TRRLKGDAFKPDSAELRYRADCRIFDQAIDPSETSAVLAPGAQAVVDWQLNGNETHHGA
ncbi:MAG TPA: hypothetical protein VFX54_09195, partial [Candidatus Binatia bacterium]|nr:hypothetical protein [Candidatus Binatia bacterium]